MNLSFKIERANAADAESILSLQKLAYQTEAAIYDDPAIPPLLQTIDELRSEFDEKTILKACSGTVIIGSIRVRETEETCYIGRLIVHPNHRRLGIGTSLERAVEALFPSCVRFELFTGERSEGNIRLYEHLGFHIFRRERISFKVTLVFLEKSKPQRTVPRSTAGIRYAHTNLIANDWRRLMEFYCKVFGCEAVGSERYATGPNFEALTSVANGHIRGQHLRLPGHGTQAPTLEIFQYNVNDAPQPASIKRPGFAHLAFEVPDVEARRKEVLEWGGRDYGQLVTLDIPGVGILTLIYMCDPEGNILELQKWQ